MTNNNPDHEPTTQFLPVEPEQGQTVPAASAADASRKRRLPSWAIALIALAVAALVLLAVALAKGSDSHEPTAASVTTTNVSSSISSSASASASPTPSQPARAATPAQPAQDAENAQGPQNAQQAPQQDSGSTGSTGGSTHRQGQGGEQLPPPPPATEARQSIPPGAQRVEPGIYKGTHTSDQFATNVAKAYGIAQGGKRGNATVQAYSPETDQSYTMSCVDYGGYVGCTGNYGASVYLPAADPAGR